MSKTLDQIYIANPITTNASTDLMYFAQSPYTPGKDAGMTYANFSAQFSKDNWVDETGASITMSANTGYTADDGASLVTFTLPTTSSIGDWVEINGKGTGLWTLIQNTGQIIHMGNQPTTITSGSLSSTNQYDCVRLRCLTANTVWTVVYVIGIITVV